MKQLFLAAILSLSLLTACSGPATRDAQVVNIYATAATRPWLGKLYDCANSASVVLNVSPDSPEIFLRLGEPHKLTTPAFQIGAEDILVAVNAQSSTQNLTAEQVRALFAGRGDPALQIWVYAHGEDIEDAFEQTIMNGQDIASSAHIAVNPQQMSDALNTDVNAVGLLPRQQMTGTVREVFSVSSFPVLAITPSEPSGAVSELIACMQK